MKVLKIIIIFTVLFNTMFCLNIPKSSGSDKMEYRLRVRIADLYETYKERNFYKFLKFGSPHSDDQESRKKKMEEMEKVFPVLIDYTVKEINFFKDKAKIKVAITIILDGANTVSEHYDYWVYKNGDWFLEDFGKIK